MKLPKKRSGNRPGSKPSLGHDRRQLPALNNVSPSHRSASFSFGMEGMPERRPTSSGALLAFAPAQSNVPPQLAQRRVGHMSQRRLANLLATRPVLLVAVISMIGMVRRLINPRFAVPALKRGNADGRTCRPIHGSERCDSVPPQERSHRIRSGRGGGVEVGLAPTRSAAERRDRGSDSDCRALGLPTRLPAY
jgi:hypothetical protein